MRHALSIAGVDPLGGAGIFADLKVFIAHNVYAMGVVTAVTSQNTKGIFGMNLIECDMIRDGINAIFDDVRVDVVKIGVLPSSDIIKTVAKTLKDKTIPIVLDPVMACKNGNIWLEECAKKDIVQELFSLATIITPNIFEAREILSKNIQTKDELKQACVQLRDLGPKSVLLKAGEFNGESLDVFYDGKDFEFLTYNRLSSNSTHGSGCSLSSAIAANLANEIPLKDAVINAKEYVFNAIDSAFAVGSGCNPINHFYQFNR